MVKNKITPLVLPYLSHFATSEMIEFYNSELDLYEKHYMSKNRTREEIREDFDKWFEETFTITTKEGIEIWLIIQ